MEETFEARYRACGVWFDGLSPLVPRPALLGDIECDVAIVGAGFTGLWLAYSLVTQAPHLKIVVLEREVAGFSASGRNGGCVSPGIAGEPRVYARKHGTDAVMRAEREVHRAIDEIGRVAKAEGIECGYKKGGAFRVATSQPQLARLKDDLRGQHASGFTEEDIRFVSVPEIREHVRVEHVLGGSYTPHCATVDPARLVRGLADVCEQRGVTIYERTEARRIEPKCVTCADGVVHAPIVVRALEANTISLPGERRRFVPMYSHMIATEPLGDDVWDALGFSRGEGAASYHHLFFYARRTMDGRLALGASGGPFRYASALREPDDHWPTMRLRLTAALQRHYPIAADARITHYWGGIFAVPRDWTMGIGFDRSTGLAWAGGYSGHGVTASNIAGRTLADLILGHESDLLTLPWVGHESPRWEPEPLRYTALRLVSAILLSADRKEDRTGRPARRLKIVERWVPGHGRG